MARIVVLHHEFASGVPREQYMISPLAEAWSRRGHQVTHHRGLDDPPPADLAVLHIDLTRTPAQYAALARRYPRVVNGELLDISKRRVSRHLVGRDSDWRGPVIVKSDANSRGVPEATVQLATAAGAIGAPPKVVQRYRVLRSLGEVPGAVWNNPRLVVEKFLPERDARGYYVRIWSCFGGRDRCVRWRSAEPVIKASNTLEREEGIAVPEELRAWRRAMKADFAKIDFVRHHRAGWIALDLNRTPTFSGPASALEELSRGVDDYLG